MMTFSKKIPVIVIVSAILLSGCSGQDAGKKQPDQSLATIPLNSSTLDAAEPQESDSTSEHVTDISSEGTNESPLDIVIDNADSSFSICKESEGIVIEGDIFTHDFPITADVYRLGPSEYDWEASYEPIVGWRNVFFQPINLMLALPVFNEDMTEYDQLSRTEIDSAIDSITLLYDSEVEAIDSIRSGFPELVFDDQIIRMTFPAITSGLYNVKTFDSDSGEETVVDTITDREFDYYGIRQSIDGIPVGIPSWSDCSYRDYDDEAKIETYICSDESRMFYDGTDIYEIHDGEHETESYLQDQPIISFEEAMTLAAPSFDDLLSDSAIREGEVRIYAAELVYLCVQKSDMSNVDYYHDDYIVYENYECYLYPFWIFYVQYNYIDAGMECGDTRPILVNAITGDVIFRS